MIYLLAYVQIRPQKFSLIYQTSSNESEKKSSRTKSEFAVLQRESDNPFVLLIYTATFLRERNSNCNSHDVEYPSPPTHIDRDKNLAKTRLPRRAYTKWEVQNRNWRKSKKYIYKVGYSKPEIEKIRVKFLYELVKCSRAVSTPATILCCFQRNNFHILSKC